jgi:hypothetical protein
MIEVQYLVSSQSHRAGSCVRDDICSEAQIVSPLLFPREVQSASTSTAASIEKKSFDVRNAPTHAAAYTSREQTGARHCVVLIVC